MPTSRSVVIDPLINVVRRLKPKSILDIGVGFGKYGYLFREYLDIRDAADDFTRYKPEQWSTRLEGVEIYPEYISDIQRMIYDNIHFGNVMDLLPRLGNYDFIWAGDIVEHLTKEQGAKLVNAMLEKADMMIGVATPRGQAEQATCYENPHEEHKSTWLEEDFRHWPQGFLYRLDRKQLLFFCSRNPEKFKPRGVRSTTVELRRIKLGRITYWRKK